MSIKNAVVATVLFLFPLAASSQEITSLDISSLQGVLRNFLDGKVRKTEAKVRKSSIDVIHRLQEAERNMIASMNKKDSSFQKLTSEVNEFYSAQANALNQTGERLSNGQHYYTPLLDSIQVVLRFLNAESGLKGMVTPESGKLLSEYDAVQANLDRLTAIEKILSDRIGRIGDTYPKDLAERYAKKLHKLSNDYSSRIQKLKELYITPDKMISGALSRFNRLEKFQAFMGKNSMLASFFRLPANGTRLEPQAIVGLQTRKSVEQLMASQLGIPGVSIEKQVGALFQRSESMIPQNDMDSLNLPEKVDKKQDRQENQRHSVSGNQRRLGFGFNFQTTCYNGIFPVTVDIGGQVNYRISDRTW